MYEDGKVVLARARGVGAGLQPVAAGSAAARRRDRNEALGTHEPINSEQGLQRLRRLSPAGCQTAHPSTKIRKAVYHLRKT